MRRAIALLTIFGALSVLYDPAHASTDDTMARYRLLTSVATRCKGDAKPNEIVVCGQRDDIMHSQRLPYPEERGEPGARPTLAPGEVASFSGRAPCPPRGCQGNGSIFKAIGKIVDRARD